MKFKSLLLLPLLTGCASYSYEPLTYESEIGVLERRLTQAAEQGPSTSQEVSQEWFPLSATVDVADGLTLAELNSLALFYSPQMVKARAEKNIAGSQLIAAGLLPNPEIFLGPRLSVDESSLIFPGSLSFPISLFGHRSATKAVAAASFEVAEYQLMVAELEVLEEITLRYLEVVQKKAEVAVREEELNLFDSMSRWVDSLFGSGSVDTSTQFLAQSERDKAYAALETAGGDLAVAESRLLILAGILPNSGVMVVDSSLPDRFLSSQFESRAAPNHPKLLAAKAEYDRASAALRTEVAKQYPDLQFGFEGESDDGDVSLGFGIGATLPIFNTNKTGISAARERLLVAREQYQGVILSLAHGLNITKTERKITERILKNLQDNRLARIAETRDALAVRFASGDGDVLGSLSTITALTEAKIEEVSLRSKLVAQRLREAVLTGKAFSQSKTVEGSHHE